MTVIAEPCALAIDLGTSGVKAAVVSLGGAILGSGVEPIGYRILDDGGAEQDPENIWRQVRRAAAAAVSASRVARDRIIGICCTSQYSSVVPVDAQANAVAPLILYFDARGAPYVAAIHEHHPGARKVWAETHGLVPEGGNSTLAHLLWVQNQRPDLYAQPVTFLEPSDYVNAKLTGVRAANQCTVLMSMLTDNRRTGALAYDETLLELAGLNADKLPPLLPIDGVVGTVLPRVADELGVSRDARVVCGANDTHALAMGAGVFRGDHLGASFGTTSVAVAFVDEKRTDPVSMMTTMPSPLPGRFLMMAENGIGAGAVRHLLDKIIYQDDALGRHKPDDLFAGLDAAASGSPPGAKGVMFLPWMIGSGAPGHSALARGAFLNLTLAAERADLVRAALEGVALNFRWMVDHCERFCGRAFPSVLFAGGGARSGLWSDILADALRKPVRRGAAPAYVNCLGTAMLVFHRLGVSGLDDLADWVKADQTHTPNSDRADLYDRLLPVLIEAHGALQPLNAKLDPDPH